jgi:transcriptional regulator with XRE-family HTH domain
VTPAIRHKLKDILQERQLTHQDLANMSKVREDYISKILRGKRLFVPQKLAAILDALGLELYIREKRRR